MARTPSPLRGIAAATTFLAALLTAGVALLPQVGLAVDGADSRAVSATAKSATAPDGSTPKTADSGNAVAAQGAQIGQNAPDFTLTDTEGVRHSLREYLAQGKTVVLEWFNPECPFIKKHHQTFDTMADLERKYRDRGVIWLAINSGAPGLQGAGRERNAAARKDYGIIYPILLDESGAVGKAYGARTTPHMFVIAPGGTLLYKGAIDDDRSPNRLGKTNYVREALEAYLARKAVPYTETVSYGCTVKYSS